MPKKPVGEPRIRKQYTLESKEEAVRQAVSGERPVNVVARDLGLRPAVLRDWMRVLRGPGASGSPRLDETGRGAAPARAGAGGGARYPRKCDGLLRQAKRMRFAFIRAHATRYRITTICRALQVSKAGYYAWV